MLKYIFSLLILISTLTIFAQDEKWHGISIGTDLSRFALPFVDSSRFGWEISGDYELLKDMYICAEIGSQTTNLSKPDFNYSSNGPYTRIGVDYNYMKHLDAESTDKMFVGLRYGFTTFNHEANNINITNDIWGNATDKRIEKNWLTANWMEATTGMRAHLFNNFYLGWSVRFRMKIWFQNDPNLQAYYIPGYGRAWTNSWVGFNYSLYYKIPFLKKKTKLKEEDNQNNQ